MLRSWCSCSREEEFGDFARRQRHGSSNHGGRSGCNSSVCSYLGTLEAQAKGATAVGQPFTRETECSGAAILSIGGSRSRAGGRLGRHRAGARSKHGREGTSWRVGVSLRLRQISAAANRERTPLCHCRWVGSYPEMKLSQETRPTSEHGRLAEAQGGVEWQSRSGSLPA
jgi:hypothetical protein